MKLEGRSDRASDQAGLDVAVGWLDQAVWKAVAIEDHIHSAWDLVHSLETSWVAVVDLETVHLVGAGHRVVSLARNAVRSGVGPEQALCH